MWGKYDMYERTRDQFESGSVFVRVSTHGPRARIDDGLNFGWGHEVEFTKYIMYITDTWGDVQCRVYITLWAVNGMFDYGYACGVSHPERISSGSLISYTFRFFFI